MKLMLLIFSLLLGIFANAASVGIGLFSESRLQRSSDQASSNRLGFGIAFDYLTASPLDYRLELAQYQWEAAGSVMNFKNTQYEIRPWAYYTFRTEETFRIYSGAMLGVSQTRTEVKFLKDSTSQSSGLDPMGAISLGGELKLLKNLSLNAEGRLYWTRYSDPNPFTAFLTQAVFAF